MHSVILTGKWRFNKRILNSFCCDSSVDEAAYVVLRVGQMVFDQDGGCIEAWFLAGPQSINKLYLN